MTDQATQDAPEDAKSDPTLKRSSVTINFTASDGYRSAVNYSNRGQMGLQPPPELPLLDAIEELSRLCALFGFGEQAAQRVTEARERVDAWRTARAARRPTQR